MRVQERFKVYSIDEGHCQVNFVTRNKDNQRVFYCLQYQGPKWTPKIRLMRASQPPWLEPCHEVTLRTDAIELFDLPEGDSLLVQLCREWIETTKGVKSEQTNPVL